MVLFPPPFYFVLKTQTSYRTYKTISSNELARPVMGTIFLVVVLVVVVGSNSNSNSSASSGSWY